MTVIELNIDCKCESPKAWFKVSDYNLYYFKKEEVEKNKTIEKKEYKTVRNKINCIMGFDEEDYYSLSEILKKEKTNVLKINVSQDISQGSISFEAIWGIVDRYIDEALLEYPIFIIPIIYEFKEVYLHLGNNTLCLHKKSLKQENVREILSDLVCIRWEDAPNVLYIFARLIKHLYKPNFITIKKFKTLGSNELETNILTEFEEILIELEKEIGDTENQLFQPFLVSTKDIIDYFLKMLKMIEIQRNFSTDYSFNSNYQEVLNFINILNTVVATFWLICYSLSTFIFENYAQSFVLLQKSLEGFYKSFGKLVLFLIKPEDNSECIGEHLKEVGFFENKDDYKYLKKLEKLIEMYEFFGMIEPNLLNELKNGINKAKELNKNVKKLTKLRHKLVHFSSENWLTPILLKVENRSLTVGKLIEDLNSIFELLLDLANFAFKELSKKFDEYEEIEGELLELKSIIGKLIEFTPKKVSNMLRFLKELYLNVLLLTFFEETTVK